MHSPTRFPVAIVLSACLICSVIAGAARAGVDFADAKTVFQTNCAYDQRIAIAVDAVIVHRHGGAFAPAVESWARKGFTTGRMFFADSDATNAYWTGKWDGTEHPGDVERDRAGKVVKCANVRPYMLPTDGWIRYLEEMTDKSLAAGATAILPEEPLAHVFTGYEESFKKLWLDRYSRPWQPQHESDRARFLTAQLKNELYIELEKRLLARTKQANADTAFVLPIHSIYSNIAAQLVAPLGTSTHLSGIDGYIGQIWTGPVNWALGCYDSPQKSFFASAYVLYDYFTQLTVSSDRKLWLLVDPVEDNPNHSWSEFTEWYKHCVVAMLLMRDVDSYEIMPWPDRIFLPGYGTGGGTPAPQDYRSTILAVTQVLQEIPRGGDHFTGTNSRSANIQTDEKHIGIAIADTLMWQKHDHPMLQGVYSLFMPLIDRGAPVSSFVIERAVDPAYISSFDVIVIAYESFKPADPAMHDALAGWVKDGGSIIVLGQDGDQLDKCVDFWWHKLGFDSPLQHLLAELNAKGDAAQWKLGKGRVLRNPISPRKFADPAVAASQYLPLLTAAAELKPAGAMQMRRGPFIIAHAATDPVKLKGKLIDIFDPELTLHDSVELKPGDSGLYRDVQAKVNADKPALLHATHRLMSCGYDSGALHFTVRGPAETPAVVRVFAPDPNALKATATTPDGRAVNVDLNPDGQTLLLRFPNAPEGVTVTLR